MSASRRPSVFLVGAPRCGTTALFRYLSAHPGVYEPAVKEPYFFGHDLLPPHVLARGDAREAEYLALYAGMTTERVAVDGTPWALYSETAAAEIAAFAPEARIVALVREPVAMLHSLYHLMQVTRRPLPAGVVAPDGGVALSFEEALATADARREAVRQALAAGTFGSGKVHVFHPDVARYTAQIRRYHDVFGPERVLVLPFDRFRADTAGSYRRVLEFLGLDPSFAPPFEVQNRSRRVRSQAVHRTLRDGGAWVPLRRAVKAVVPRRARKALVERLIRLNVTEAPRPTVEPETAARLRADFHDEVAALGELLGEDLLTRWGYRRGRPHSRD